MPRLSLARPSTSMAASVCAKKTLYEGSGGPCVHRGHPAHVCWMATVDARTSTPFTHPAFFQIVVYRLLAIGKSAENAPDCANARKGLVFSFCYCVCLERTLLLAFRRSETMHEN